MENQSINLSDIPCNEVDFNPFESSYPSTQDEILENKVRNVFNLANDFARIINPAFSITFESGCQPNGQIKWTYSDMPVGYFEYVARSAKTNFLGINEEKVSIFIDYGYGYGEEESNCIIVIIYGLPHDSKISFSFHFLTKKLNIEAKLLPNQIEEFKNFVNQRFKEKK